MAPEVDVIVPVLWRTGAAGPFMATLAASGASGRVRVIVVTQNCDVGARQSWMDQPVHLLTVPDERISFAAKVNDAYTVTGPTAIRHPEFEPAPWLMLVGDDVAWTPGWLDLALACASDHQALVVGTNDGGYQARSEMSPHPLIARSYVDRLGASWDGPGVVAHEGYRHNYVDREILQVAQSRGVYAFATGALVKHLHHGTGTAPVDSTYELGTRSLADDKALWKRRCQEYL